MQELILKHKGERKNITMEEYVTSPCSCLVCSVVQTYFEITDGTTQKGWEHRVEADDSSTDQDEKVVVRADLEDNNNIDLLLTRTGTGVVENEARDDGKIEVVTEEEVRAGA